MATDTDTANSHLSAALATFAANLRFEHIPAHVLRRAEDLLLDCLDSILAGVNARAVQSIERYAVVHGSKPLIPSCCCTRAALHG